MPIYAQEKDKQNYFSIRRNNRLRKKERGGGIQQEKESENI